MASNVHKQYSVNVGGGAILTAKLLIAAVLPWPAALLAQQAAPEQTDTTVFRTETRLVVLHATAEDKDGKMVTNLNQSAFQVFENGVKQQIKSFRQEDVPVSL